MSDQPRPHLKDRVAELEAQIEKLKEDRDIPDPILESKGDFFGRIIASFVASEGSRGMSESGLQRIMSNAERLWNTYVRIVRGDEIRLWEDRLDEERARRAAVEAALAQAKRTISAQAETIRALDGIEDDALPEEASEEEVAEAVEDDTTDPNDPTA